MTQVKNSIYVHRQALGLSQWALAREIGTTQAWLSIIENGHVVPNEETKERLADALRCKKEELWD